MDTYQPIYDAVRSRLSNGDIGAAIESALRSENIGFLLQQIAAATTKNLATVAAICSAPSAGEKWLRKTLALRATMLFAATAATGALLVCFSFA